MNHTPEDIAYTLEKYISNKQQFEELLTQAKAIILCSRKANFIGSLLMTLRNQQAEFCKSSLWKVDYPYIDLFCERILQICNQNLQFMIDEQKNAQWKLNRIYEDFRLYEDKYIQLSSEQVNGAIEAIENAYIFQKQLFAVKEDDICADFQELTAEINLIIPVNKKRYDGESGAWIIKELNPIPRTNNPLSTQQYVRVKIREKNEEFAENLKTFLNADYFYYNATELDRIFNTEGKPEKIDDIVGVRDSFEQLKTGGKLSRLDGRYEKYYLNEDVGFDKCKFSFVVKNVDVNILSAAIENEKESSVLESIGIINVQSGGYLSIKKTDDVNEALFPGFMNESFIKNYGYCREIKIIYSAYALVEMRHNNAKIPGTSLSQPDVLFMEIHVEPTAGHEKLGNISNYSYHAMRDRILEIVYSLKNDYGITVDEISLNDIEINKTFQMDTAFDNLRRSLQFYQVYIDNHYKSAVYYMQGNKEIPIIGTNNNYLQITGMYSKSSSVGIKIYDKYAETISSANTEKQRLLFSCNNMKSLVRVEFEFHGTKSIFNHFKIIYDNADERFTKVDKIRFDDLSQNKLTEVFNHMVDAVFYEPYKLYYKDSIKTIEQLINGIDLSHKNKWKTDFVKDILSQEVSYGIPFILGDTDIDTIIKYHPVFRKNRKRYQKTFQKLLSDSETFSINRKDAYNILGNFIDKVSGKHGVSHFRLIQYKVEQIISDNAD